MRLRLFAFIPFLLLSILLAAVPAFAEPGATVPAAELAGRMSAKQHGSAYIRVRMEIPGKEPLQLQIKSRASRAGADIVYQILFPRERKGEGVLLQRSGNRLSGTVFTPPDKTRSLSAAQLNEPLFGSDLTYEDVIDNHFEWEQQAVVGTEVIDRVKWHILESKPGKGHRSNYSSVRTWVDPQRFVPLVIEKYGEGGRLLRRINVTRVLLDGDESIPVNLAVGSGKGAGTAIDGSRIKRGVSFSDEEFSPAGLRQLTSPRATSP